jgi:hypothetical protein
MDPPIPIPLRYALMEPPFSLITSPHSRAWSMGAALLCPSSRERAHRSPAAAALYITPMVPTYGRANTRKQLLRLPLSGKGTLDVGALSLESGLVSTALLAYV